jgi:hypothetical protein
MAAPVINTPAATLYRAARRDRCLDVLATIVG